MAEPPSDEERLAGLLLEGMEALRGGRHLRAAELLAQVCDGLEGADELLDVRARALALLADALLHLGEVDSADTRVRQGLELARSLGDANGVTELQKLWARVAGARQESAEEARRLASAERLRGTTLDELRASFGEDPGRLAEVLVKKANAELDGGAGARALPIAEEALALAERANSVRAVVFALLSVARADPARASAVLEQAWRRAERANEFNLVGAVARAAHAQGVNLPEQVGPDMGARSAPDAPQGDDL